MTLTLARTAFLLAASLLVPGVLSSQAPLSVSREFVLPTPGLGVANAIIELRDGGFAAVGYADAGRETGTDAVLVRFNAAGDTLWTRSYGGDREDFGWDVVELPDGGFVIVGYTEAPAAGREDVLVMRVDASGAPAWERTFGGPGRDRAWSATLAGDEDIVLAAESEESGRRDRNAYLIRVSGDGEAKWIRSIDEPGDQRVFHIARTEDGAFVVTGTSASSSRASRDVYVARVDADGDVDWTRTFGGEPDDVGHGVMALGGGDVLVTGYGGTRSNGGTDVYLLRLDAEGNLRWWRHDGGPEDDRAMMSAPRAAGGYATVGFSMMSAGPDVVILENDPQGSTQTRTVLARPGSDRGVMIVAVRSGGYVLAGTLGGSHPTTGEFAVLWLEGARGSWQHITPADGLPAGEVRTVFSSSTGVVWFGVRGQGLAALDGEAWQYVTMEDGLVSNGVAGLEEVRGALWAVGQGGYSLLEDGRWQSFADVGGRVTRVVFSLTTSAEGAVQWFGANGFAARLDSTGWTHYGTADGLPHAVVHQVWTDRAGATWFACRRGLARLHEGAFEVFHPEVNFRSIVEDTAGRLWFGTGGNGVLVYSEGRWEQHMDGQTVLPSLVDGRGHVWARTEGAGVYRHDGRRWIQYTTADGLLSDVVYAIASGDDGSIWFGTDRGASRHSPP
ncbi:MAG: hypothetical protein HKM89_15295 [Gemmatimonadales bacterium]|nr:hypothetical protein [Gemmatimonadales bacterium]